MAEERSGSDKPEEKGEREDSEQSDHQVQLSLLTTIYI